MSNPAYEACDRAVQGCKEEHTHSLVKDGQNGAEYRRGLRAAMNIIENVLDDYTR